MTLILTAVVCAAWIAGTICYYRTGKVRWLLGPALLTLLCLKPRSSRDWRQRMLTRLSARELETLHSEIVRLQARSRNESW